MLARRTGRSHTILFGFRSFPITGLLLAALLALLPARLVNANEASDVRCGPLSPELDNVSVYVPLILRDYPLTPAAPTLNRIANDDGNGDYVVSWTTVAGAMTYRLQEDTTADFAGPTDLYSGSEISTTISGRSAGTYYYRARAANLYAGSDWSNVESVTVAAPEPLPACPQAGPWSGTTSQGLPIEFAVATSPDCHIPTDTLKITRKSTGCPSSRLVYRVEYPITNNHFSTLYMGQGVEGDFTSAGAADGTFSFTWTYFDPTQPWLPPRSCSASGTWTAAVSGE